MQDRNSAQSVPSTVLQRTVPQTTRLPLRANHGSSAWSLPSRRRPEVQPQDGSLTTLQSVSTKPMGTGGAQMAGESEDSRITGGTRSLSRRVLGLNNVAADQRKKPLATSALPVPVA